MNNLIDGTITDFDEGDLVNGTVVKIEHDATFLKRSTQQNISTVQIHVQLSAVCRQATIFS